MNFMYDFLMDSGMVFNGDVKDYVYNEKEDVGTLSMLAAGFEKDDFEITMDSDTLVVSASRKETPFGELKLLKKFKCRGVDAETLQASYKNGVLGIEFGLKSNRKRIPIVVS